MFKKGIFYIVFIFLFVGCQSTVNTFKRNSSIYLENTDESGEINSLNGIIFDNITFFEIPFLVRGINNLDSEPILLAEGRVSMRGSEIEKFIANDQKYKYL